ncbi:hypothetical protein [Streptomyces sp. CoH27]|uniref:hypothetical protein n=1 Tax=Streptomyces sp. CoH27 TaxID=2875763 RepID=UPI0035A8237C
MRPHRPVPHAGRKRATATAAARTLGLGAQEKLVVKDVVEDNDGTVHTLPHSP